MPLMDSLVVWTQPRKEYTELENTSVETSQIKMQRGKGVGKKKREQNIQELGNSFDKCNIHIIAIPHE